ncbi:MAG: phage virion morphogenesis protein [Syntrophobacteraceae bacterium]
MSTITIAVSDREVQAMLSRLAARLENMTPVMRQIGEIGVQAAHESFDTSTAPDGRRWKPSRRAMLESGMTLIKRGILKNSIHYQATEREVRIGTPVAYGPTHHFGAKRGSFGVVAVTVRAHVRRGRGGKEHKVRQHARRQSLPWGNIPARRFLGLRPADWNEIRDLISDYALSGRN